MRLDKLLANMGFGSRKDVKGLIKSGSVAINEETEKNNGKHVDIENDKVTVNGELVTYKKYIYLLMNKAPGYLSATYDNRDITVIDILPDQYKHFEPFPVGRLDKDTEGLLLITNDGQLAHHLTSPKKEIEKTYFVRVGGKVTPREKEAFNNGVTLDDGYVTKSAQMKILKSDEVSEVHLTITEGKFHQVKRMFASQGMEVLYLQRIRMGELVLDPSLEVGEFRELTENELNYCLSLKD